jgi:hypothetical protein
MAVPPRYLQVVLDLPKDDHQTQMFEQYMRELMPTFTKTPWPGWQLFLSAFRDFSRDSASGEDAQDRNKQYLNVWRVQDYNSLPYIMERFDDDETYRHLDALVLREVQNFAGALSYDPQTQHPGFTPPEARFYLRVGLQMNKDPDKLSRHSSFMIENIHDNQSWMRQAGWTFVQGTYAQTDRLSRHFQIWSTKHSLPNPEAAVNWLMDQADFADAVGQPPEWEVWEPIDYASGG